MSARRWLAAVAAAVGVGVSGLAIGLSGRGSSTCGTAVVGANEVPPVFAPLDAPVVRTDLRLQRLIAAVQGSGFGRVVGAVGYDQAQWLRSAAVPGGFASWTAANAVIGFRDPSGRVRWGLRQTRDPQAWAVIGPSFLNLDLRPGEAVRAASYDSLTGAAHWCRDLGEPSTSGDPLTVARGSAGSLWVVTAGPTLSHLNSSGSVVVQIPISGVDRAAFVKQIGPLLVAGGRAASLLTAPDPNAPGPPARAPAVTAFDAGSLAVRWAWGEGVTAHLLGTADGLLLVEVARAHGLALVALDVAGRQRWTIALPAATTADMTIRGSSRTVIVRSAQTITGYDAGSGARRWSRSLGRTSVFPDGFDLAAQPEVGARMLIGARSALMSLDPETGQIARYPLPTDGSLPTFWPYEIVVSGRSAIVETTTGAVLVALGATT